jgi:hypothetical protein
MVSDALGLQSTGQWARMHIAPTCIFEVARHPVTKMDLVQLPLIDDISIKCEPLQGGAHKDTEAQREAAIKHAMGMTSVSLRKAGGLIKTQEQNALASAPSASSASVANP